MFTRDKKPKTQNTSKTEKNKDLFIQPKLSFGKSGDAHEVEADKMAEKVVNKPTETKKVQKKEGEEDVQAKPLAAEATPVLQRKESSEEDPVQKMEEEETVQSKEEEESVQKMEEEEAVQSKEDEEIQSKEAVKKSTKQKASFESKLRRGSGGQKLDKKVRNEMEAGFGSSFNHIKIHNDSEAAEMSKNIGAQAFTHGNDIYFNKGKYNPNSKEGKTLLAHELTHTIQQKGMVNKPNIQLRKATWLERKAWTSYFNHYLPNKFLNNYMDDTGKKITLTKQEMKDCKPRISIRNIAKISREISKTHLKGGGTINVDDKGLAGAYTPGTLGNFTVHYKGTITVKQNGDWSFEGKIKFIDYWDFDPKPFSKSGRSNSGEMKTIVGYVFLAGKPFKIDSVWADAVQTGSQLKIK